MEQNNIEVTNEDLARMVKNGFDESTKNLADFRNDVNERFTQVDKRFDQVDRGLDNLGHKVNQVDRRLFSLEEDIADMKLKKYKDLPERVTLIEGKLGIESAG